MCAEDYLKSVFYDAGMPLSEQQIRAFLRYYELLAERNKVMNLTAITEFQEAAVRHFADSCMLFSPVLDKAREEAGVTESALVIDVGTGAGFPGLPLKILKPDLSLILLDALKKRVDFLDDVITALDLNNAAAIHARAEEGVLLRWEDHPFRMNTGGTMDTSLQQKSFRNPGTILRETFDLAVSRAVAHLSVLLEYCLPFVRVGGCFAAYKSGAVDTELMEAGSALQILGGEVLEVERFRLPKLGDERSIVFIKKTQETPLKYPRRAGKPGKNPL